MIIIKLNNLNYYFYQIPLSLILFFKEKWVRMGSPFQFGLFKFFILF